MDLVVWFLLSVWKVGRLIIIIIIIKTNNKEKEFKKVVVPRNPWQEIGLERTTSLLRLVEETTCHLRGLLVHSPTSISLYWTYIVDKSVLMRHERDFSPRSEPAVVTCWQILNSIKHTPKVYWLLGISSRSEKEVEYGNMRWPPTRQKKATYSRE